MQDTQIRHRKFCRAYLRSMNVETAARESGYRDGYRTMEMEDVQARLERMREAAGQVRREDVIRRLAQLAFGRVNDGVKLALRPGETEPAELDLAAVSEIKVTDKGGVEVKFIDRLRALETLHSLLEGQGENGLRDLLEVLNGAGETTGEV